MIYCYIAKEVSPAHSPLVSMGTIYPKMLISANPPYRTQIQQAAAAIDVIEPGPASAGVALAPAVAGIEVALVTAGLASASAADQIEVCT